MNSTLNEQPSSHFHEIPRARCEELLAGRTTGRVAWNSRTVPRCFPSTMGCTPATSCSESLPMACCPSWTDTANVAFEIDDIDEAGGTGWSVMVRGRAQLVASSAVLANLWADSGVVPWAPGTRNVFIAITPRSITGRMVKKAFVD